MMSSSGILFSRVFISLTALASSLSFILFYFLFESVSRNFVNAYLVFSYLFLEGLVNSHCYYFGHTNIVIHNLYIKVLESVSPDRFGSLTI